MTYLQDNAIPYTGRGERTRGVGNFTIIQSSARSTLVVMVTN